MKFDATTCFLRKLICFLPFLLFTGFIDAQVTADFTSTVQQGCGPLLVQFTDASKGNPVEWQWDLGNGATSTEQNPQAIYISPGKYTIKLTVKNATTQSSANKTDFINVLPNPTPVFTANPLQGCAPINISFFDKSLPGAGNITNYIWDFGDGTTSAEKNPVHTYNTSGSFTISLNVTNSFGCNQIIRMI